MINTREQFVVDENGRRTAVLLELERYQVLIDAEEELESIRLFDQAKTSNEEAVPFSQAVKEIEKTRK